MATIIFKYFYLIINEILIIYRGVDVPFPYFLCSRFLNFASSID